MSKPLGTGMMATAFKADFATAEDIERQPSMAALNRGAAEAAVAAGARALTDVTGFGLAGHLTGCWARDGPSRRENA